MNEFSRRSVLTASAVTLSTAVAGCTSFTSGSDSTDDSTNNENESGSRFDDDALRDAYTDTVSSVVGVGAQTNQDVTGSGWVVDDGVVVTNHHVIESYNTPAVWVTDDGWYQADVIGSDVRADVAVLNVPDLPAIDPLPIAAELPTIGTPVVTIGYPGTMHDVYGAGKITGHNGVIEHEDYPFIGGFVKSNAIQGSGSSGSPLLTRDGDVVGMVTYGEGHTLLGTPPALLDRFVNGLNDGDSVQHSLLMTRVRTVSSSEVANHDVNHGVVVIDLGDQSPLQPHVEAYDSGGNGPPDLITELDGEPVHTRNDYRAYIDVETRPGDSVDVTLYRTASDDTETVTVETEPGSFHQTP